MVKVLLVLENSPYENGGIERHCRSILELFNQDSDILVDYLCKDNILYSFNKLINKVIFNRKVLKDIINKYDVVHVHGFATISTSQALSVAIKSGIRLVYTAHYHPFNSLNRPLLGELFFKFYLKNNLSKINTIIAINNEDKQFFERYNQNVVRIPNWQTGIVTVDTEKHNNMILSVGRNDSNKALYHLNYIDFNKYDVHCVTEHRGELDQRITIHSNISDEKLSELYTQASLLIVPSRYEAFSYVVLEALERGTPALVSKNVRIADYFGNVNYLKSFHFNNYIQMNKLIDQVIGCRVDKKNVDSLFSPAVIKKMLKQVYVKE